MADRETPDATDGEPSVLRRNLLKGAGAAGVVGVIGTGAVLSQRNGGSGGNDNSNNPGSGDNGETTTNQPPNGPNGNPMDPCDCPDMDLKAKYDFEDCEFVHEEGPDLVDIHYDGTDPDQNKEGEECEPIVIDYTPHEGYEIVKICAFGGNDNDQVDIDPPATHSDPSTYVSDLETPGGQRAAISNLRFCLQEVVEEFVGYQVDLIHGDVLETLDPETDTLYNRQNRLLQAYWSGTGMDENIDLETNTDEYQHCLDAGLDIHEDIEVNDTATACLSIPTDNLDQCDLSEFKLVVYSAPVETWTPERATEQEVYDVDDDPDIDEVDGLTTACFEVDLPPLME